MGVDLVGVGLDGFDDAASGDAQGAGGAGQGHADELGLARGSLVGVEAVGQVGHGLGDDPGVGGADVAGVEGHPCPRQGDRAVVGDGTPFARLCLAALPAGLGRGVTPFALVSGRRAQGQGQAHIACCGAPVVVGGACHPGAGVDVPGPLGHLRPLRASQETQPRRVEPPPKPLHRADAVAHLIARGSPFVVGFGVDRLEEVVHPPVNG
nr:hypothetical protein [Marihabitans asiaticum]